MKESTLLRESQKGSINDKIKDADLNLRRVSGLGKGVKSFSPDLSQTSSLLKFNLLNNLIELAAILPGEVKRGSWLDAYLVSVGMNQIIEDELHPDPWMLGKAEKYLAHLHGPAGVWSSHLARTMDSAILRVYSWRPQFRKLVRWQVELARLVQLLAQKINFSLHSAEISDEGLLDLASRLTAASGDFPERIQQAVLRLPSCFRSFDQHPDDMDRLARMFLKRWPEYDRPLVVVGLRTSGSYLAPLLAASLKANGAQDVRVLTLRPGRRLMRTEIAVLKAVTMQGGHVLLTDDPPSTGKSIVNAARDIERAGVEPANIVFMLQFFGTEAGLPAGLRDYQTILLPWGQWSLQDRLQKQNVQQTLNDLWAPEIQVLEVEQLTLPSRRWERSHAQARFRVICIHLESRVRFERQVSVKGVGLGYFGQHAIAVARLLPDHTPTIYGFKDGLLYREWLEEEKRLVVEDEDQAQAFIQAVASYTAERNLALAVPEDVSRCLFGQRPVWEAASNLLSRVFGRGWVVARPILVDPLIKQLLWVHNPSVVDGKMDQFRWFSGSAPGNFVKIDFDERDFSNLDLYCYDPIYDLAGAALELPSPVMAEKLRFDYSRLSGKEIDEERWLIYTLVHLWDRSRSQDRDVFGESRGFSRVVQEYFSSLYFSDLEPAAEGELCALDMDGVLESNFLGFPSLSPASALALRALIKHGYSPLLATGRSLSDVRERCANYKLAGGVAEYGAVVYNHLCGEITSLLTDYQTRALDRLRKVLGEIPGIVLDPDYCFAVRAFQIDESGHRHGLDTGMISNAIQIAQLSDRIRAVPGVSQTDFMISRIDKASGLRVLARQLGVQISSQGRPAFALAVGDTSEDLPMLRLAELAAVPAHADQILRAQGENSVSKPYQAGMAQAVSHLLGHAPGKCPSCRAPSLSSNSKKLLDLFAIQEAGKSGMLWRALALVPGLFH